MQPDNKIIQSLWVGPELSPMEILCIKSYVSHGHEFHLYLYDNVRNVPNEAILRDANDIIPQHELKKDPFGGYVNFSNQFRYMLLFKKGGWWVDMDTVCLKPFDFEEDFVFSSEDSELHNRIVVNTTYIKSTPGAKFLRDCLDFIESRGYDNIHWGELGVTLISRMIFRNQLGGYIRQPETFCPVSVYKMNHFISETGYNPPAASYAIHWWHEIWRRLAMDKYQTWPTQSLYERMKIKYYYE